MFADDTNLFYSHKNIKTLFQIVNSGLKLVNECFFAPTHTKKFYFDSLLFQLPIMTFNNIEIKRGNSTKFPGDITHENLTWKNHIEIAGNKISKNIGVFYRPSHLFDFKNISKNLYLFQTRVH